MDLQKQPVMATKEQLRLAELTQTGTEVIAPHDDVTSQKRVKKVIELTRCTQSQAEVALIDSEGNVEDAVARLLDNPEKLVLWSQQGKNKKAKGLTPSVDNESKVGNGRRADSQRSRQRQEGMGHQNTGPKHHLAAQSRSLARPSHVKEQNGPNPGVGSRPRTERQGFKGQGRTFTGGAYRRDRAPNDQMAKAEGTTNAIESQQGSDSRTWNNGEGTGIGNIGWGNSTGWDDDKKAGDGGFSTIEASYGDTRGMEKDDEWKNGPRVFMPSSAVVPETLTNNGTNNKSASNWPALENFAPSETVEPAAQKPKTFAAVAAAKKAPPPPSQLTIAQRQPQQVAAPPSGEAISTAISVSQNESSIPHTNLETKISDGPVVEWSNSTDWGNSLSPQPSADQSEFSQHDSEQLASTSTSNVVFGDASVLSMSVNVNQEYTDQLKNAIGLVSNNQPQHQIGSSVAHQSAASVSNSCDSTVDYIQQHNHLQRLTSANAIELDRSQEKVEFVTGEALPPPTSTSYQFGFHFSSSKESENTWAPQQHIPSMEISTEAMLNPMSNIPTTSSSVSAHFNAISQQAQAIEAHQRLNSGTNRPGNALSFSDTASVNFPPSSAQSVGGGSAVHANPSNFTSQQSDSTPSVHPQQLPPQNKTLFTPAANPSMVSAPPTMQQHLQQQAQTIFHQTSAAAVPQFPNYNMPYMYSPVAAAQTLTAPNAEIDRFLIQQYGTPYSQLDLQMGAMSIGPPTTLAPNHHRATLDSYMENKFGQQQQNINQVANNGHYQQSQQSQQQRGLASQSEPAALLGGPPSHVGPPPGFGMPTAPTQPSYVQPANIHSLFQMPTYPHPYQHPQYMMSNANRFQTAQRPAQTSPPEGNVQNQRRAGNESQGYTGAAGQDSAGEQHSVGVSQQYGNNFNHKYRSYM